jgi:hypothetical protein
MKKITLGLLVSLTVSIIAGCSDNTTHFPTHDEATITINQSQYESESETESNANADSASQLESELTPEISGGTPLAPESFVLPRDTAYPNTERSDNSARRTVNDEVALASDRNQNTSEPLIDANVQAMPIIETQSEDEPAPQISGGTPLAPESFVSTRNSAYRGTVLGVMSGTPPADNPDAPPILLVTLQHSEGANYGQSTLMVTIDGSTRFNGISLSDVVNGAYLEVAFDCDPAQGHVNATSVSKFPAE